MTNPSPLVPQGLLIDPKNKGRARVKIAVFVVLAVHGVGLLALLMQGCRQEDPAPSTESTNNVAPTFDPTSAPPVDTTGLTPPAPPPADPSPAPPLGATTEYTIAKGDNLSTIASQHKVTLKALMEANPTIEPTKLQIGQKIQIPPPSATATAPTGTVPSGVSADAPYTVKSGDTLSKIATDHHTTVRALRAANNLTTDRIVVGQKLIIPKAATPPTTP
jgi:LysM repeat protein